MDITPAIISLKTTLAATFITFILGLWAAWYVANYNGKLKGLIDSILTLPLVLPPIVAGFALLVFFGAQGPFDGILKSLHTRIIFTWASTVIAATVVSFPLMYRTTRSAFEQIDKNVMNAAKTLGVSNSRIFFHIVIPLAWPGIAAATVLTFARALGEFGATVMVSGNIPGVTQTMPISIYFAIQSGDMKTASIWVVVIFLISVIVMTIMNYWTQIQTKIQQPFSNKTEV